MHTNLMLDLETMGTGTNAAIISIGAVYLDLENNKLGKEFYTNVDLKSSVESGGVMDPDTVMWWLGQSEEARNNLINIDKKNPSIEQALLDFTSFIENRETIKIWGNGSDFDNVILAGAYFRCGIVRPWSFRNNRCYRTLKALHPEVSYTKPITSHNALEDAKAQAQVLLQILKR